MAVSLTVLGWMGWDLIFSDHGYLVYRAERQSLEEARTELETMKAKREVLAREILRLRNDPKALEELVHRELGYVHPDEYMVIMPEGSTKQGAGDQR